jgi:DNA repair protein RadD
MLKLRPYQRAAINALYAYWQNQGGNGLIVLPTGAGKSLVLAELCRELLGQYPSLRIGIVTHVKELIQQNFLELMKLWPAAPAGIYSAGIGRRDARARILFCGIQSVWNKVDRLGAFDLLLVDEAHLIPKNSETSYGRFIAALRAETLDMRVVGLTATPFRLDTGRLDQGKDRLFDTIVYDAAVTDLIEQGYLSPLISKATAQQLDTSGVAKRGGEYVAGQLEIAVNKDWITRAAADEMIRFGQDRKAWLAFCAGVKHAEDVRDALRALGINAEAVTGETQKSDRDRLIKQFRAGQIRCLTSVGVLGTGFNVPQVDMIALLRPTESAGLFCQQVGRGLRRAEGKTDCLVLDFAGLTKRHGPIDQITIENASKAKDEKAEPLAKECPDCGTLVPLSARACPTCSYVWPERMEPKHDAAADASTAIISKGAPTWVDVDHVAYYRHEKIGSPPSMRAEYHCGFSIHREWVCLSHQGFARSKAEQWWLRSGASPIPKNTDEAISRTRELRQPSQIQIRPDGKYFSVVGRRFDRVEVAA